MNLKNEILKEIKKVKPKISKTPIGVQIPEGLKQYTTIILDELKDYQPILFTDPCYGACDLKDNEAKRLGVQTLIHFGHYKLGNPNIETIFIPISYTLNNEEIDYIIKNIKALDLKEINLVTTIQYLKNIEVIKNKLLEENIVINKANKTPRVQKHMVLGCDFRTISKLDSPTVFIGDGKFHANLIAFKQEIVYTIDPLNKKIEKIQISKKFLQKRYAHIAKARNAKSFGILVSSKSGQNRIKIAEDIKKKLELNNKKAYILASDFINKEYLLGIKVEAYINTACPRIVYDDSSIYNKPIITVSEVDLIFDINKDLTIDQMN